MERIKRIEELKNKKWKTAASYTVEASFVVPILFFILFTVIHFTFRLHDNIIADAEAAHAAEEGRMAISYGKLPFGSKINKSGFEDEESREYAEKLIKNDLRDSVGQMMLSDILYADAELDGKSAEVEMKRRDRTGRGMLLKKLFTDVSVSAERKSSDGNQNARIIKTVFRMGKKILDV